MLTSGTRPGLQRPPPSLRHAVQFRLRRVTSAWSVGRGSGSPSVGTAASEAAADDDSSTSEPQRYAAHAPEQTVLSEDEGRLVGWVGGWVGAPSWRNLPYLRHLGRNCKAAPPRVAPQPASLGLPAACSAPDVQVGKHEEEEEPD